MATDFGNAAKRLPDDAIAAEPSMEEILDSIKQIIADDGQTDSAPENRADYRFPDNPSNSNRSDELADEVELQAALQSELNQMSAVDTEVSARPLVQKTSKEEAEKNRRDTLETRVAAVREELSSSSVGLSPEERLEHYRSRNKLKTEALAEVKVQKALQSQAVVRDQQMPDAPRLPPLVARQQVPISPSIPPQAAQFVATPTTETVVKEMAAIMMKEKSEDIEAMLSELMRPTIRQWLNDNLPSLVQRLVREEIRAASRGQKAS